MEICLTKICLFLEKNPQLPQSANPHNAENALAVFALAVQIGISEELILKLEEGLEVPKGQIGEIIVKASWVTKTYFNREDVTHLAKI